MSGLNSPPSYAPTSTSSYTPSNANHIKYHREIDKSAVIKSPLHKNIYDSLAEIYSIVTVMEMIEKSFLKDYITDKDKYTSTTLRLINQYQIIIKGFQEDQSKQTILADIVPGASVDSDDFSEKLANTYNLHAPLAIKRLQTGVPVTIEHLGTQVESSSHPTHNISNVNTSTNTKASGRLVAEVTGNFITCMDALKLNYKTKDQLHPLLSDLVVSLNDLVTMNDSNDENNGKTIEFPGKSKLISWLIKLNNLEDQELVQSDIDTFLNDLDSAYKNFYTSLE
ncbi:DEHA2B09636p [Debaryomyces hansenii CBS767]|uniref:Vacuolar protein sorting-associated protein 28 n=1 Tax=Debaryomyces hansenii (strain ATCC 36239 / CBS 767 / BCRC 21394 / JCM 1990 / NBRC 0083 / IGC 2968) TaxID=284592 RepID=Q6BWP7_DEBHA|nr:DEHA2B09636p [Debaryomyces hansenii CBS767]CAG85376.2 DEHA2B09636p [Debaryomyces hansenii CBS767]|eukprot:XP_457372.2 DEHA2B09636p [Debaryomyces hansenii CBS767]